MARSRFSGDFLLKQYRDAITEQISEKAVYERIDNVFVEKLNQFEKSCLELQNNINSANNKTKDELVNLIKSFSSKYEDLLKQHQFTLISLKTEVQTLLNKNLSTDEVLKIVNESLDKKLGNINKLVTTQQIKEEQVSSPLDAFESEYQEFINGLKRENEKRMMKKEIVNEIIECLPSIIKNMSEK